ncbi:melatonin receptor type 1B-like [Glandiceps talaboti]
MANYSSNLSDVLLHTNGTNGSMVTGLLDNSDDGMDVLQIIYLITQVIIMIVGDIGNIMVIGAVLVSGKLYTAGNIFIMNLAIADLWVTAFVDTFSIIGIIRKHHFFVDKSLLCEVIASSCLIACIASLWNIMAIGINRYIYICKNSLYKKVYTKRNTSFMVAGIWLCCVLMDLPNFLGWGGHVYDHKTMVCTYERTASYSYTLFFTTLAIFIPQIVVCVCYLNIYLFVRRQRQRITSEQIQSAAKEYQVKKKDIQLMKTLFTIFMVFFICWGPYVVVVLADFRDDWPQVVHVLIITMAHANSSVNSILYGLLNKRFRESYWRLLSAMNCFKSRSKNANENHSITSVTGKKLAGPGTYIAELSLEVIKDTLEGSKQSLQVIRMQPREPQIMNAM